MILECFRKVILKLYRQQLFWIYVGKVFLVNGFVKSIFHFHGSGSKHIKVSGTEYKILLISSQVINPLERTLQGATLSIPFCCSLFASLPCLVV